MNWGRKNIIFVIAIFVITIVYLWRYLFIYCVIDEERAVGGFYEPINVLSIKMVNGNVEAYIAPKEEDFSFKKIGPITLIFQPNYSYHNYFISRIKIGDNAYPILFYNYTGPLYIYIPRIFLTLFGKSIYTVRSLCLITFVLCIVLYLRFLRILGKEEKEAFLLLLFLLTHPFFSSRFISLTMWANTAVFIFSILFLIKIKKIENFILPKDLILFSLLGGLILHFHLLAGGALLASMVIAFLLTKRETISFKRLGFFSILFSTLIFLLLILPFLTGISFNDIILFLSKGRKIGIKKIILAPLLPFVLFIAFTFFPSFFIDMQARGRFDYIYIPFSSLSGLLIFLSIVEIIRNRRENSFQRFVFITIPLYFIFTMASPYLRPLHFDCIFILIAPYIFSYFIRIGASKKFIHGIVILSIFLNFVQIEMLRKSILNSYFSLKLQKDVLEFLERNGINEVYNFFSKTGFELLSGGRIKTIHFYPYLLSPSEERLLLSLLYARGKVVMVEKFKRREFSTGISKEKVMDLAGRYGLKVKIIKNFPSDNNPIISLIKVEF